jgi:hypothetical protein
MIPKIKDLSQILFGKNIPKSHCVKEREREKRTFIALLFLQL